MPERVDDPRIAVPVVLIHLAVLPGTALHRARQPRVGVVDLKHQAHRRLTGGRRHDADLRVRVGEVEHSGAHRQRGVPDPPVRHHDRLTDAARAEHVDVPVNRRARVVDGEVRHGCAPAVDAIDGSRVGVLETSDTASSYG